MSHLLLSYQTARIGLARHLFAGLLLLAAVAPCGADDAESPDPFETLNMAFRGAYSDARTEVLEGAGPVVMSKGDYLVLFYQGERLEGERANEAYHQLKTVSHVPLAIYVMLAHYSNNVLPDAKLQQLRAFRDLIGPVRQAVNQGDLPEHLQARQRKLLDDCVSFMDRVLADRECSRHTLLRFCSLRTPDLMHNVSVATHVRLEGYHRQMQAWRKQIAPDDWRGLKVVVVGAQMPRPGNLAVQYFARLLRETGVHESIVYAEALFDEEKALNLLGTHQLDAAAARAFFNDPRRLHRDLLSDATTTALETLDWTEFRGLGTEE